MTMTTKAPAVAATETFGVHLMVDVYGADPLALSDGEGLGRLVGGLVEALGMHQIHDTVVVEVGPQNRKDPGGVSAFAMIAESHISIHTFPKRRFASMDVYTCQSSLDEDMVRKTVGRHLGTGDLDSLCQPRGVRYPASDCA